MDCAIVFLGYFAAISLAIIALNGLHRYVLLLAYIVDFVVFGSHCFICPHMAYLVVYSSV